MPQPAVRDVHTDAILTQISVAYIQQQSHFIANRVFPVVPVNKQSDKYYVYTKADWFRDEAQRKGDTDESAGSGYDLTTSTYFADVWAFHKDVGDQSFANSDAPLNPERDAAQFVTQRLMLRQEIQWASDFMTSGSWDNSVTGATNFTKWSDYDGGSDPVTDVETGKSTILQNTGFKPNKLVLGYTTFRYLKNHPDLVDRFKHTTPEVLTESLLASIFGVDEVLVCMAIKNTGDEDGTAAYSFVQTAADALLLYVAPNPSPLMPSAGYTFAWNGVSDGLGQNIGIRRIPLPKVGRRAVRIEGQIAFDNVVIASDLGYYFTTAV